MALKSVSVCGFRNLAPDAVELARGRNYLFGPNGAGKTNLLEAIHYLAIGRSFRRCPDSELLGFGQEVLVVSGHDESGASAEIRFDGREKRLLVNGAQQARLSDYLGWLPVVVLLLEDIELVRGGPGIRRGFLDMAIAKTDRSYIAVVGDYRRALVQRNRLLETRAGEDQLAVWTDALVRAGVLVSRHRRAAAARMLAAAAAYCARLARGTVGFEYRSSIGDSESDTDDFRLRLASTRLREQQMGQTLVGPHRDDVKIVREGRDLRRFGSVGEQRLAGIALRLAEADLLLASARQRPVFLLDEIASELDEERGTQVFDLIAERGQMVYAAARRTVRPEVSMQKSEYRMQNDGPVGTSAVFDAAASLGHSTTGPLGHGSAKEFHIESGRVTPA